METLLGTLAGGLFRLTPEILKWFDRKDERKHELAMLDRQHEADKLKLQQTTIQTESNITLAEIQAIVEATKVQGQPTSVKWVDGFNAMIRPLLALQWLILLWPAVILASFFLAVQAGISPLVAIGEVFGQDEKAMAASIASFWLVDRSLRKMFKH